MTQQEWISKHLREHPPAQRPASASPFPARVEMWLHGVKVMDTAEPDPSDAELDARFDRALGFRLDG